MIEREKVLANNLLIGDKDSPTYSYKNRNLRSGSLKGSFSLDPIVNELAVDTFQFTVHYDPDAQRFAYSPVDTGNGVYRCATDGSERGWATNLENCGWIKSIGEDASVNIDTAILDSGSTSHSILIAPPVNVRPNNRFERGDKFSISFNVLDNWSRVNILTNAYANGTMTSETGFVTLSYPSEEYCTYGRCSGLGSDTLNYDFSQNYSSYISFTPVTSGGVTDSRAYATIEVTEMVFNGERIFKKPDGKIYLCRPTNPIPLDKYLTDVPYGTPVWWMCEES